jgi:hypothetical protein
LQATAVFATLTTDRPFLAGYTTMPTYEEDVVAWSVDQARLLRAGAFDQLDIAHIAEEIEDVGKSEQRELTSRMGVLIGHLLKWQYQPLRRGASWEKTIKAQRKELLYALDESPSLKTKLSDPRWIDVVWSKGVALAVSETGLDCFPETCDCSMSEQILNPAWWPG